MTKRIALIDTVYPGFLSSISIDADSTYDVELRKILDYGFGTSDFWSHNLSKLGWTCIDIIANCEALQRLAPVKQTNRWQNIALEQIAAFEPDVVFLQDLSFFDVETLRYLKRRYLLAGQCSCPMPDAQKVGLMEILFTSFPHYVDRFRQLGVKRPVYMPLAFEPRMLEGPQLERDIDISFVGGVGRNSHWKSGTDVLEAVAERFKDRFRWYGYGLNNLAADSPLTKCYRAPAWGRRMYDIYRRSKIVVNRHGEVAQGYSNNLRMYEATGMGAMLMTEASVNQHDLFPRGTAIGYGAHSCLEIIQYWLDHEDKRAEIATAGQSHTLANHTYAQRMQFVSDVLLSA